MPTYKIMPLRGKVVLEQVKLEQSGPIFIPEDFKKPTLAHRVIAIGAPAKYRNGKLKRWFFGVGQIVLVPAYAAKIIDGTRYRMCDGDNVLAVIK